MQVNVDLNNIARLFSKPNLIRARLALAHQFDASAKPFIPEQKSHLKNEVVIADDGSNIVYTVPYAAAQMNGGYTNKKGTKVVFKHWTIEGTGPHWDERVKSLYMSELTRAYLKGGGFIGQ